jgi:ketosteroid isomerase-like protein
MSVAEPEIKEFLARYEAAANSHDFSNVAGLIHPDAFFRFTDGDHMGREAIRKAFEDTWAAWDVEDERYELTDVKIVSTDSQSAVITYTFNWSGVVKGKPFSTQGRGTNVIVRSGDGLQFIHEHLSS